MLQRFKILAGIVVVMSGGALPWLVNPAICYIGKVSYSCYLVHFAALGITLRLLGIHLTRDLTFYDTGRLSMNLLLFTAIMAIALVLTAVIATVTLHLIETPGIALGRIAIRKVGDAFLAVRDSNKSSACNGPMKSPALRACSK